MYRVNLATPELILLCHVERDIQQRIEVIECCIVDADIGQGVVRRVAGKIEPLSAA